MKKTILLLLVVLSALICVNTVFGAEAITIKINGEQKNYQNTPVLINGRAMVPLQEVCEDLNCKVTWEEKTKTAQLTNKITIVAMQANNRLMFKKDIEDQENVRTIELDVPPRLTNDTFMVPARAIAEALNAKVDWKPSERILDITMEYEFIADYKEDLAIVMKNQKYGAINKERELVIPPEYEEIDARFGFCNGMVRAVKDGKEGYIDQKNQVVIPFVYDFIGGFYDEENKNHFYQVNEKYDGSSFYEKTGKFTFTQDGVSMVEKDGKQGIIDTKNQILIPIVYHEISDYYDGMAIVYNDEPSNYKIGGQCALVDKEGKEIIPYGKYDAISLLDNMRCETDSIGYGIYAVDQGYGRIDTKGNIIIDPIYDDVYVDGEYREGKLMPIYFRLRKGNQYGAALLDGSKKTDVIYDSILYDSILYEEGRFFYTKGNQEGMLDKNLNAVLQ